MKSGQSGGYVRKLTQRTERLRWFLAEAFPIDCVSGRTARDVLHGARGMHAIPCGVRTRDASAAWLAALYCTAGGVPAGMPRGDLSAATRSSDRLVRSVAMAWSGLAGFSCSRASESYT